jgi:hypothetical protein
MTKFFWFLTCIIVALSFISGMGSSESILDTLFLILWCSWGPLIFAAIYQVAKNGTLTQYVIGSAFLGVTGFAFYILSLTTYAVVTSGPLNESALIFIAMPFGFLKFSLLGSVCGGAIYYLLKLYRK